MHRRKTLWVTGTIAALFALPGWAASLHVSAASLRMAPGQATTDITLSNPSDNALVAQVQLFAWSQDVNEEHLSVQQELTVSPTIATLPAHSEQVVRIVRPANLPASKELTYRLLVDELPGPVAGAPEVAPVDSRIHYSIPLFVSPGRGASDAAITWALVEQDNGWFLRASNAGGTHAQVSAVKLMGSDGETMSVADGLLGYALAGSTRQWKLSAAPALGPNLRVA